MVASAEADSTRAAAGNMVAAGNILLEQASQVAAGQDRQEVRGNVLSVQARVQGQGAPGGSHNLEANLTVRVRHYLVTHNRGRCHLIVESILDNRPYNLYT